MCITKTSVTFLLLIVLAASLSSYNVLASEIKPTGRIDDMCPTTCSATYGNGKCKVDCMKVGFASGQCATSDIFKNKCCCTK
ncbi:PREDICTED: defensin-like protein 43 [Camelina sativa]|uniref:Defensin-like protein 43 n=1 Tax=Camelina sativa TaxID=90675 RepID=A0ABM1RCR5_CAMSA|nr:PREDICTED: defensin-like protein 43 [Camelina sativa]